MEITVKLDGNAPSAIDCGGLIQMVTTLLPLLTQLADLLENCPQPDGKIPAMLRGALEAGHQFDARTGDGTVQPQ